MTLTVSRPQDVATVQKHARAFALLHQLDPHGKGVDQKVSRRECRVIASACSLLPGLLPGRLVPHLTCGQMAACSVMIILKMMLAALASRRSVFCAGTSLLALPVSVSVFTGARSHCSNNTASDPFMKHD